MDVKKVIVEVPECPEALDEIETRIRGEMEAMIGFARDESSALQLRHFERLLFAQIRVLFRLCVALFLEAQRRRVDLGEDPPEGWRVQREFAQRTIKTLCGPVRYGRAYLRTQGRGFFPLDAALGITQDRFSWCVIDLVTRLATRVSYAGVQSIMRATLGWAPSTESIEALVIGLGQRAAAYMAAQQTFDDDGQVLVIEIDGKAAPMATEEELRARRGRRQPREQCACGCQRHRGRQRREGRKKTKKKKRKTRGHNSKNGRSAVLVAMYTLRREGDQLHGPINKKVWGQFSSRKAAIEWARAQATRRGFPPDTGKRVQVVVDGEPCLRQRVQDLFPTAVLTLDLRHAQERLWKAGRLFHREGSPELEAWVAPLNSLLLAGKTKALLKRLKALLRSIAPRGPGTKAKRDKLSEQIRYFEQRQEMMHYDQYRREDLVLATGVIEGACRHVVGERLDCAGMRWIREGAEPLLQLRCIELNGDWESFITWVAQHTTAQLHTQRLIKIRNQKPSPKNLSKTQAA